MHDYVEEIAIDRREIGSDSEEMPTDIEEISGFMAEMTARIKAMGVSGPEMPILREFRLERR